LLFQIRTAYYEISRVMAWRKELMERHRLIGLAIAELERQKAGIDQDLETLRAELGGKGSSARQKELASSAGTRRTRTTAERKAQSRRMKEYWAQKRAQAAKPAGAAKTPAAAKVRKWTAAEKKALSLRMKEVWKRRAAAAKKDKA
jgi:hypothetical protein